MCSCVLEYGHFNSSTWFDLDTVDTPGFAPFESGIPPFKRNQVTCQVTRKHACCFTGLRLLGVATNPCCQCSAPLPIHNNQRQSEIEKMISHVDPFDYRDKVAQAVWYGSNNGHWEYAAAYSREFNLADPYQHRMHPRKRIISLQHDKRHKGLLDASLDKKSWDDVLRNKYVVTISGNAYAGLLKPALLSNSCVLRQDSMAREWYEDKMTAWVHYVPIKYDLSDLFEKISWAKEHDVECEKIASQGRSFALENFARSAVNMYIHSIIERGGAIDL